MTYSFTHFLIKGKIAEIIFDQMFREAGEFTVIPFGYESLVPELSQRAHLLERKEVLDAIKNSPDFAIVSHNQKQVFLVEVKYRTNFDIDEIIKIAEKIHVRWKLVWLFVATPEGFYFASCSHIIHNRHIEKLQIIWISLELQDRFLKEMNKFLVK